MSVITAKRNFFKVQCMIHCSECYQFGYHNPWQRCIPLASSGSPEIHQNCTPTAPRLWSSVHQKGCDLEGVEGVRSQLISLNHHDEDSARRIDSVDACLSGSGLQGALRACARSSLSTSSIGALHTGAYASIPACATFSDHPSEALSFASGCSTLSRQIKNHSPRHWRASIQKADHCMARGSVIAPASVWARPYALNQFFQKLWVSLLFATPTTFFEAKH